MHQIAAVSERKVEWIVVPDCIIEGSVYVTMLQHDVDELSGLKVLGDEAIGGNVT